GHSVYGTFHANRADEVVERITSPPMNIPGIVMGSLPLIVVQHLNRRTGQRRTLEIVELIKSERGGVPSTNTIYLWNPKKDTIEKVADSIRVKEELELFSGMSEKEMNEDLLGKQKVLKWLLRHDIKSVNDVGRIVTEYYIDKDAVLELIEQDKNI
ncbi:MAG: hypothetical protein DRO94_03740, partial [Candidatus Altiarchaeales archaeon]